MSMLNRKLRLLGIVFVVGLSIAACGSTVTTGPDSERFVQDFVGGVAADEPRAVLEGQKVLSAGGNAADAATAIYFTLAVTLPSKASLGGGGVCMVFDKKTKKVETIDFLSRVPADITTTASRPSAVPGNPLGIFALHARYGSFKWARLVAIGERMARFGVKASRSLVNDLTPNVSGALIEDAQSREVFLGENGKVIGEGYSMRQADLATTLSNLRQDGPTDFYQGNLARLFVKSVRRAGGSLSLNDLRAFKPKWRKSLSKKFGMHEINFMPPPASGGLVAAQMFGMLISDDLFSSASADERYHVLAETALRSYGDRERWLRDDFSIANAPRSLISNLHLNKLISNYQANHHLPPNAFNPAPKPRSENSSATSFVVVDRDGSAVACSHTMNNDFGTGRIAKGTGIMLAAAPIGWGKGPTALGPVIVRNKNSNNLFFVGAASGGIAAPTALMNVLARSMMVNEKLGQAISATRVHHGGAPDITFYEPSMAETTKLFLSQRGHKISPAPILGLVNAVYCSGGFPRDPGSCVIKTDPRGSGLASNARE
jgi:gamma-glutamyltranspeptidase/glutathione hydrolase